MVEGQMLLPSCRRGITRSLLPRLQADTIPFPEHMDCSCYGRARLTGISSPAVIKELYEENR